MSLYFDCGYYDVAFSEMTELIALEMLVNATTRCLCCSLWSDFLSCDEDCLLFSWHSIDVVQGDYDSRLSPLVIYELLLLRRCSLLHL